MKYKIKYVYKTGNSFNTYTDEGELEIDWTDLSVAKQNLKRIKEHYDFYKEINSYFSDKTDEELIEENKSKDWFYTEKRLIAYEEGKKEDYCVIDKKETKKWKDQGYIIDTIISKDSATNYLILYTDENKPFQFWPQWCGYFETLISAEIIPDENDMKIEF